MNSEFEVSKFRDPYYPVSGDKYPGFIELQTGAALNSWVN
jgi:hypothetical protein